jgi:hypothetical protein
MTSSLLNGRQWLKAWSSLKLTIVCLILSMILVFLGTLAQVELGIYEAQQRYFSTWFVWWGPDAAEGGNWKIPILPGGYLVGGVLFFNLLAAHGTRFKWTWKKSGIFMTHIGILLLLVAGFVAVITAEEGSMRLKEGSTSHFIESFQDRELAVVDTTGESQDRVYAFQDLLFEKGATLGHDQLPIELKLIQHFPNSRIRMRQSGQPAGAMPEVNRGFGQRVAVRPHPVTYKQNEQNLIALTAQVREKASGKTLGTWLFTNAIDAPQSIEAAGRTFRISLRPTRTYLPYSLRLIDFRHDKYPGTEVPYNFSSKVQLLGKEEGDNREALIYMNHPLRYDGRTYFQMSFAENDTVSILQVVKNPGWLLPYISCLLLALGLMVQFGIHLGGFLRKRSQP